MADDLTKSYNNYTAEATAKQQCRDRGMVVVDLSMYGINSWTAYMPDEAAERIQKLHLELESRSREIKRLKESEYEQELKTISTIRRLRYIMEAAILTFICVCFALIAYLHR